MYCNKEQIKRLERDLLELARRRQWYQAKCDWLPEDREAALDSIARGMAAKQDRLAELKGLLANRQ